MKAKAYDDGTSTQATTSPGAFMPDGSFNEQGGWSQQGPAHALICSLVRQRRTGTLTVEGAISLVEAAKGQYAFPSLGQWAGCGSWAACWAQTAAEEAVKRCGNGTNGHWCGDSWARGPEKDCQETRHHERPMPDEMRMLTSILIQGLGTP